MSEVTVHLPDPIYTLVTCTRDGMPEICPWHLRITMFAEHVIDNGMPAPEESKLLFRVADRIEREVLKVTTDRGAVDALFLARSTWNESRELYFRVHDPEPIDAALRKMVKRKTWYGRGWDYEMTHDPDWEKAGYVFQVLTPSVRS